MFRRLALFLCVIGTAFGAAPSVWISVPSTVNEGDTFPVTIEVSDPDNNLVVFNIRWQGYGFQGYWETSGGYGYETIYLTGTTPGPMNIRGDVADATGNVVVTDWNPVEVYPNEPPFGWIDNATASLEKNQVLTANGWAADNVSGAPISYLQLFVDGSYVGSATLGGSRPDVASAYGRSDYTDSGWTFSYNIGNLSVGNHTFHAIGYDNLGLGGELWGAKTFTVVKSNQQTVSITPNSQTVVVGAAIEFTAAGGNGSGAYTWGGDATGTGTTKSITFNTPGTRTVTVHRAADANYNVSNTATATITVKSAQVAATISPASQDVALFGSVVFTAGGGSGTGGYVWGGDASGTGTSKTVTFNTPGTRTVTVYRAGDSAYVDSAIATATLTVASSATLTVIDGQGGGTYAPNSQIQITRNTSAAPAGQSFSHWTLESGSGSFASPNGPTTTFTTGAVATTIKANFAPHNPSVDTPFFAPQKMVNETMTVGGVVEDADFDLMIHTVKWKGAVAQQWTGLSTHYSQRYTNVSTGSVPGTFTLRMEGADSRYTGGSTGLSANESSVVILPHNDPPVATGVTATVISASQINFSGTATDPDGNPITVIFHVTSPPSYNGYAGVGSATVSSGTGNFTWNPSPALANGTYYVWMRAQDSNGALDSNGGATGWFTIGSGGAVVLALDPPTLPIGNDINVDYANAPATSWIGIYRQGDPDTATRIAETTATGGTGYRVFNTSAGGYEIGQSYNARLFAQAGTSTKLAVSGSVWITENLTLTVVNGTGGATGLQSNDTRSITANSPPSGQVFTGWSVTGPGTIGDALQTPTSFNMDGQDATVTANFAVPAAPSITTHPQSQSPTPGQNAVFTVVATGAPPPTFQWYKNGTAISGATQSTFSIMGPLPADSGNYTVVATNPSGSVTSNVAVLNVLTAPTFVLHPQNQSVPATSIAVFRVTAAGNPAPTYQWYKNGVLISGATQAILSLINVQAGDAASYTVKITNSQGNSTSNGATLTVTAGAADTNNTTLLNIHVPQAP